METIRLAPEKPLPSLLDRFPAPATQAKTSVARRKLAFWSAMLAVPAAYLAGRRGGTRRTGAMAGGLALLGLGLVRWQLARWFTETPAYETLGRRGELELRRYPFRIEARSEIDTTDLRVAVERGYQRLECYIYGANSEREDLACVTPILTTMRDGVYTTAFVMPPRRSVASLPDPDDLRVQLREVAERQIVAYPFRGPFTRSNIAHHERKLLRALVEAGLVAKGSITLAIYDAPATLPVLRRNELWIDVV